MQCVLSFHRKGTGLCVFFSYKAKKVSVVSFSSVWAFGPEFKSPSVKSRLRGGKRQIITYDYQVHQFHWFGMAVCNLPLQEETPDYLAVEHRRAVVHMTEWFQVFSLSPAYPRCFWTGHIISCVRSKVPWRHRSPHRAGAVYVLTSSNVWGALYFGHCTPTHYSSLSVFSISSGCLWHLIVS